MNSVTIRCLVFLGVAVAFAMSIKVQRKQTTTTPEPESGEEQAMPMDMILNHCPVLCSPDLKTSHPLRHLVPSYSMYGSCMDDCICAAYCYMVDGSANQPAADAPAAKQESNSNYDSCFVRCSTEVKPFTNDAAIQQA